MVDHTIHRAAEEYVERMGLLWEGQGLPRIAGRMIGYLGLQPDAITLDEMADALGVSKASVSNDARRLERLGFVARVGRAGDRRDYYALAPDMPARVVAQKLEELEQLQASLVEAADLPDMAAPVKARLQAFGEFQHGIIAHMRVLLESFEKSAPELSRRT